MEKRKLPFNDFSITKATAPFFSSDAAFVQAQPAIYF